MEGKIVGLASGADWKGFFTHLTLLGLANGERCVMGSIPESLGENEVNANSGSSELIVNSTRKKVMAVDAGSTKTIMAVADGIKGGKILNVYKGGSVLSDRVGQDKALENLKGLLCSALDGDHCDAACISMPSDSIEKNSRMIVYVQSLISANGEGSNGPLRVIPDYQAGDALLEGRAIVLNCGASAWCHVPGSAVRGGRTGQFASIGGGDWIGQQFYRMARDLQDAGNSWSEYFLNSIAIEWVIKRRYVTSDDIREVLVRYDELAAEDNDCNMRLEMLGQFLQGSHDDIVNYTINAEYIDWSSLAPVCEACALAERGEGSAIARRILEQAGIGLAKLIEAAIVQGDKELDIGCPDLIRDLTWMGGVISHIPIVKDTCFDQLRKVPDLRIDRTSSDPIFGLVKLAQGLILV